MADPAEVLSHSRFIGPPLKSGNDGGTYDPMEARMKALEDRFEKMDGKLDTIIRDLAYVKAKVEEKPSTLHLLGFATAIFIAAGLLRYFAP